MAALRLDSPLFIDNRGAIMADDNRVEWIRTSEAAQILGVKSTEGVLIIVRGKDRDNPQWIVRFLNVGTEDKPRFMLAKEDIIRLAEQRKNQTDL